MPSNRRFIELPLVIESTHRHAIVQPKYSKCRIAMMFVCDANGWHCGDMFFRDAAPYA
jgi:hypothetical protein